MRIAFDVSPFSHPPTGIGNYLKGALAGLAAAGAGSHEIVPFAPTSLKGPERIRARLADLPVRSRLWPLPASHALRTAWSIAGFPPTEWLLGRFDALVFTDWMTPPQRGGLRATTIHDLVPHHRPEWCTPRTIAMHRRKDGSARRCDVVFANSANPKVNPATNPRLQFGQLNQLQNANAAKIANAPPATSGVIIAAFPMTFGEKHHNPIATMPLLGPYRRRANQYTEIAPIKLNGTQASRP